MRSLLIGLILGLIVVPAAYADSDGYYCVGADYLAVEFRSFNTPGLQGVHVLKIARFDEERRPRWTGELVVEEFQTHTLTCEADHITFAGAGERGRGLVLYIIQLDRSGVPRALSHTADPQHSFSQIPPGPPNLGNWAKPEVTPLPATGRMHQFQLHVTQSSRPEGHMIRHDMKTELEELDKSGSVIRTLLMNQGTIYESTGG